MTDVSKYLRLATTEDIPTLVRFARNFHRASNYNAMKFSIPKSKAFIEHAIVAVDKVVLVALSDEEVVGFLVGAVNEPVFSSTRIAAELGWWVEPEYRGSRSSVLLYNAYEDWAKRVGAECIQGAYLPGVSPDLDEFYKKRGYLQVESSYLKVLRV